MPFQLRFFSIFKKDLHYQKLSNLSDSFPDVYVFKKNCSNIGVKFRNMEQKKYGFKIHSVQVKICKINSNKYIDPHLNFYQDWIKLNIPFEYKLILPFVFQNPQHLKKIQLKETQKQKGRKKNDIKKSQIKQNVQKWQSFNRLLQDLNEQLIQVIGKVLRNDQQLKSLVNQDEVIDRWLKKSNPIDELFIVRKSKNKMFGYESGHLNIQTVKNKLPHPFQKQVYFNTISYESTRKDKIQFKIAKQAFQQDNLSFSKLYQNQLAFSKEVLFKWNCSYPQLLQDLYEQLLKGKKYKNDQQTQP